MNRILALQSEHNLTLPEEFHFKYAEVALAAGRVEDAVDSVNQYLVAVGREGPFYREALELLDCVEQIQIRAEQIPEQACAGQPERTGGCWLELENQPECYVWKVDPIQASSVNYADRTATWTGACVGALARGEGTLTWVRSNDQETHEETGPLRDGQKHGQWVIRTARGTVEEGPYVKGRAAR